VAAPGRLSTSEHRRAWEDTAVRRTAASAGLVYLLVSGVAWLLAGQRAHGALRVVIAVSALHLAAAPTRLIAARNGWLGLSALGAVAAAALLDGIWSVARDSSIIGLDEALGGAIILIVVLIQAGRALWRGHSTPCLDA
jgi:hypothetical protein